MIAVARLAQVHLSYVLAVEEHMRGLHILGIHHVLAADDYLLRDGIRQPSSMLVLIVVSAVAHDYLLVLVVSLVGEQACFQTLAVLVRLAGLYLERGRHEVSAPSARYLELRFLVEQHRSVG